MGYSNDEAWRKLQRAAERYCELLGLDPMELVPYTDPDAPGVAKKITRRALIAGELNDLNARLRAINEVANE